MTPRIAIVGAGIAGAGIAYYLGERAEVTLIETETQPGYHTTGRSAAFYLATYGGPAIEPLTTASTPFFEAPPAEFGAATLFGRRGALHVADAQSQDLLSEVERSFEGTGVRIERLDRDALASRLPQLRDEWRAGALWEPDCHDIDVAALHQGFLKGAKRAGAKLVTDAPVRRLTRRDGVWLIETPAGDIEADIVVNAAGAWGDEIAALAGAAPLGLMPLRRTVAVVDVDPVPDAGMPLVIAADGSFYFKPDAGRLWVSPHDEVPSAPTDAQPDEYDVAVGIDRFEQATTWRIKRLEHAWAGLRTFAPDRLPVYGFDPDVAGFFWCVGQGGFGIQTAPAGSELAAALLLNGPAPAGLDTKLYLPQRFR